jgi:hypothetical protein
MIVKKVSHNEKPFLYAFRKITPKAIFSFAERCFGAMHLNI